MFELNLMEIVAKDKQSDRLHEAEIARLLKGSNRGSSIKLKISVLVSGAALALLMIAQIV